MVVHVVRYSFLASDGVFLGLGEDVSCLILRVGDHLFLLGLARHSLLYAPSQTWLTSGVCGGDDQSAQQSQVGDQAALLVLLGSRPWQTKKRCGGWR